MKYLPVVHDRTYCETTKLSDRPLSKYEYALAAIKKKYAGILKSWGVSEEDVYLKIYCSDNKKFTYGFSEIDGIFIYDDGEEYDFDILTWEEE